MKPQTFQHPEIRDENDNIIQPGSFGKNTPFCTKNNDGILDYIANDLEYLYEKSVSADNDDLKAKSLAVSGTSDLNLVNADTVKAKSLAVTGTSAAPTAPTGDSSKTIANTEFVQNTVSGLVGAAPETLDTLNELATALGNDPNFATTVSNQIGKKANQTDLAAVSTKVDKKANQTDLEETVSFTNRLQRKKAYKVGDIVYSSKLPSWAYLECTQAGTTAATEPNLSTVSGWREVNDGSAKFRVVDRRLKAMIDILYPVGIVVTTATDDALKPGEEDGLTQWEEIASGRGLIGAGTGADTNDESVSFTAGNTGGEYKHKLTKDELPEHAHAENINGKGNDNWDNKFGSMVSRPNPGTGDTAGYSVDISSNWNTTGHPVMTDETGENQAHNNMQPYLVVHFWKRVS